MNNTAYSSWKSQRALLHKPSCLDTSVLNPPTQDQLNGHSLAIVIGAVQTALSWLIFQSNLRVHVPALNVYCDVFQLEEESYKSLSNKPPIVITLPTKFWLTLSPVINSKSMTTHSSHWLHNCTNHGICNWNSSHSPPQYLRLAQKETLPSYSNIVEASWSFLNISSGWHRIKLSTITQPKHW